MPHQIYFGRIEGKRGLHLLLDEHALSPKPFNIRRFQSIEITIDETKYSPIVTDWLGIYVVEKRENA